MSARRHDPLRLDVAALAAEAQSVQGQWPMATLERLWQSQSAPQDWAAPPVLWSVRGEQRSVAGGAPQIWLHLQADATVWLACQRCMQPYRIELSVKPSIRFVRGEDQAEALDAESEHDVLALARSMDLSLLVEDEFLLALPIVPMHGTCPEAVIVPLPGQEPAPRQHPFAVLGSLKPRQPKP